MAVLKSNPLKGKRVAVESLEARLVFSTLTVNTLVDNTTSDSLLTLRESALLIQHSGDASAALGRSLTVGEQAQINAAGGYATNTVLFDNALANGTITLDSQIEFTANMTIDGGDDRITLAGGGTPGTVRAFFMNGAANLTLNNLTLRDFGQANTINGEANGGAILGYSATITINGCTFVDNVVTGGNGVSYMAHGDGGAIWLYSGVLNISNSTFSDNIAQAGPGGYRSADGGAVWIYDSVLNITNSTFTRNKTDVLGGFAATFGGAIYAYDTDATLNFVTMYANDSFHDVRGMFYHGDQDLVITNSIIAHTVNDHLKLDLGIFGSGSATGSNNLIRYTNTNNMGVVSTDDPKLAALADNGGLTHTIALLAGSPALDAGGPTGLTTDQRGLARVAGVQADLGAFEAQTSAPSIHGSSAVTQFVGTTELHWRTTGAPVPALSYTGTLPTGLTFTDNGDGTASLTGTTAGSAAGQYNFQILATNGVSPSASFDVSLTLTTPPPPTVTAGTGGAISVMNPDGSERFSIANPFPSSPTARRVASGDLTGDGTADILVASGPGSRGKVIAYNGTDGTQLAAFSPFEVWTGAIFVTSGDVNHDGAADIIVGTGSTKWSRARVKVFNGADFSLMREFEAFLGASTLRVAAADLDGDGYAEIVATRGGGAAAKVRVFDGQSIAAGHAATASEFIAHDAWLGGCFVATGDIDNDGQTDVIVSQDGSTRPYVTVFNGGDNTLQKRFQVSAFAGAPIASRDTNADGYDDILVAVKIGNRNAVQVFSGVDDAILDTLESDVRGRLFVA